ncbi:hypothetical protein C791_1704 [Amycolatopsis azurea DSM 43854]|uniref:Uncharacterized protein n=1 Tax=Amycolatopsis azurea DSM 43854 TaxID=1238180 RepID=M2QPR3_9PSEU|nr:hypothetical protein C791_1704 [Amycolatopsis azurea DSM 43854]
MEVQCHRQPGLVPAACFRRDVCEGPGVHDPSIRRAAGRGLPNI